MNGSTRGPVAAILDAAATATDPPRRSCRMSEQPSIEPSDSQPDVLVARGEWILAHSQTMLALLERAPVAADDIDGRDITRLDSAGAMLLSRYAMKVGLGLATVEVQPQFQPLTGTVQTLCENPKRVRRKD